MAMLAREVLFPATLVAKTPEEPMQASDLRMPCDRRTQKFERLPNL